MAHLSGTYSNANAGRLRISLYGTFYQGGPRDGGFPQGTGNYLLGGSVNENKILPIDRFAPTSYMELDYPGGNIVWSVYTYDVSKAGGSGTQSYGFINLVMTLFLVKK